MPKKKKGKMIAGNIYNKTNFGKKWSDLTKKYAKDLNKEDVEFLRESLLLIPRYREMVENKDTKLTIKAKKFQKYPVRGIILISPNSKNEIYVGKKQVMDALYPTKKKPKSAKSKVAQAFRQAVEEQMRYERNKQRRFAFAEGEQYCPLSGKNLKDCEGTELDHYYPFSKMMDDFVRKERTFFENIDIKIIGTYARIVDKKLEQRWRDYHYSQADLRLTCKKDNRKKSDKVI